MTKILNKCHIPRALEIIQVLHILYRNMLQIEQDIIFIIDRQQWAEIYPKWADVSTNRGKMITGDNYIFINLDVIPTIHDLACVMLHEMLHVKYPKMEHPQLEKIARKYIHDDQR